MRAEKFSLICEMVFLFVAITDLVYSFISTYYENAGGIFAIMLMESAPIIALISGFAAAFALPGYLPLAKWYGSILAGLVWWGGKTQTVAWRQAQFDAQAAMHAHDTGVIHHTEALPLWGSTVPYPAWWNTSEYYQVIANCYHDSWECFLIVLGCLLVALVICYVLSWHPAKKNQTA